MITPDADEEFDGMPMRFQAEAIDIANDVATNGFRYTVMRVYVGGGACVDVVLPTEHVTSFAESLAEYGD